MCVKKISVLVACVLGGGFMCLQYLAVSGYIEVNHEKLKRDVEVSGW